MKKLHQNVIYLLLGGGGSINLKFVFSVSSLVYLEKYGLKKYEGQKKHSCTALHSMFYNMPEYEGVFIGYL
jgi:hypothetical protein